MWAQKDEKVFWLHWLQNYKNSKCLWHYETKKKASRSERMAAYQDLADLAKVVNPAADINFVRSRINAFRTCYRREFKKMEAARQNGINYKPQLFYFDMLKFVNPDEFPEDSIFEDDGPMKPEYISNDDPINWEQKKEETTKRLNIKKEAIRKTIPKISQDSYMEPVEKKKKQTLEEILEPNFDGENIEVDFEPTETASQTQSASQKSLSPDDEYSIVGKRIAAHFRNMEPHQRLIAEKIISDVCIYARMERLTMQSSVLVDAPTTETLEDDNVDYDDPDTYIYTS